METNFQTVIAQICANYNNLNEQQIQALINATNEIGGCSMVAIKDYSSDKSNNTEIANQLINVGASYQNMIKKDSNIYANFDVNTVDVDKFNYATIDTGKLTLEQFKQAVKENLSIALVELQAPKKSKETNDIYLNKALVFNLNTLRLSVIGQQINKTVEVKGEFKIVKSSPKTIAKRLIEKQAKGRTQTLRRFALDNVIKEIRLNGETIEIG
jgi:hypothetical protein